MQVLIYNDVLRALIKQDFALDLHKNIVNSIFSNASTSFVFSKKMLEILKDSLEEEDLITYYALVTRLGDIGSNMPGSDASLTMEDEAVHLNSVVNSRMMLNIAYKSVVNLDGLPRIAFIANQVKPNYDWLICNLAILHPNKVSVSCFDFSSNSDVDVFFNNIYSLNESIGKIIIFDTQCNLSHNKFNYFINRKSIDYFTKRASNRYGNSNEENYDLIKEKLISNFKMFVAESRFVHGRRVIVGELIITADNDYWNLNVNGQDWTIDVQISPYDADKWRQRCLAYYTQYVPRVVRR